MATQPETAVGSESVAEPTIEDRLGAAMTDEAEQEDEAPEEVEDEATEEEADPGEESEEEIEDEAEEAELPPIDPPVSLTAEEKEAFKDWPRDAQEAFTRRIGDLERGFNSKAQEAARAREQVTHEALSQLAQIERSYAERVQQYAGLIEPVEPDVQLLISEDPRDRATYAMQDRAYKAALAQRASAQQQAQAFAQQAQEREAEIERQNHAEQVRIISDKFPEYLDPATAPELNRKLTATAKRIGYSDDLIAQARADDILAMRQVADAFDKADKYDALMSKQMKKVRAAKGMPKAATPGQKQAPGAVRAQAYAADRQAMQRGDKEATARVLSALLDPKAK